GFLSIMALAAQETRSTINGRVYDTLMAPVSGAKVVLLNTDTNATVTLKTNDTGFYEAQLLIPGNYRISARLPDFKTTQRDHETRRVGQQLAIDIKLEVGAVAATVQVTADAPVLDVGAIEAGSLIDNQQLMDLPNMGNNPTLLVKLMPGVQTDGNNNYLGL